jgi:competence protein ComFC
MRWWSSLFPGAPSCWFCRHSIEQIPFPSVWTKICKRCTILLSPITGPTCSICGRPSTFEGSSCPDCLLIPLEDRVQNVSVASYTEKTKNVLARFKYYGDERYAEFLGDLMGEVVSKHYQVIPFTLITNVPLHPSRMVQRGFNQAQLLAEQIGTRVGLPTQTLLERKKSSISQANLGRSARLRSLGDAFQLTTVGKQLDLAANTILLVDDVYTTGTTIRECAKIFRIAGVKSIFAVTFAR